MTSMQDDGLIDMDYFEQLIQSKIDGTDQQQSYQEVLAARQMEDEWDPQEELSNALNEIRKNEKEMSMIATVA